MAGGGETDIGLQDPGALPGRELGHVAVRIEVAEPIEVGFAREEKGRAQAGSRLETGCIERVKLNPGSAPGIAAFGARDARLDVLGYGLLAAFPPPASHPISRVTARAL